MIDPSEIFDAHRVVKSPSAYRAPIANTMRVLPHPVRVVTDGTRRGALVRTITGKISERVTSARRKLRRITPRRTR